MQDPGGFQSLSGLAVPWNTPFARAREILQQGGARGVEEQGMRVLRFSEIVRELDLSYDLIFSPDYGYGLRSAAGRLDKIGGLPRFKDAQGSYRPLVDAYMALAQILRGMYGEPSVAAGTDDAAALLRTLDRTREQTSALLSWLFPTTRVSHELAVSFVPRHQIRFAAAHARLVVVNRTPLAVSLAVDFSGGSAAERLGPRQERVVELPQAGEFTIRVEAGKREKSSTRPISFERLGIGIRRAWFTGSLRLVPEE